MVAVDVERHRGRVLVEVAGLARCHEAFERMLHHLRQRRHAGNGLPMLSSNTAEVMKWSAIAFGKRAHTP